MKSFLEEMIENSYIDKSLNDREEIDVNKSVDSVESNLSNYL